MFHLEIKNNVVIHTRATFKIQWLLRTAGLLIFCGKKIKISRDFQGQIRRKIGRFCGIFMRKKSKFAEKSADFSGKKFKFPRIFRGKFLEKSADFTGTFRRKLCRQTISKKQPILLDLFCQIWFPVRISKLILFLKCFPNVFLQKFLGLKSRGI